VDSKLETGIYSFTAEVIKPAFVKTSHYRFAGTNPTLSPGSVVVYFGIAIAVPTIGTTNWN
jgi:sorbitol-specific phosphotransferase system component IIC